MTYKSLLFLAMLLLGSGGFFFPASAVAAQKVVLQSEATDPLQVLFEVGLVELNKGNTESAVQIFQALAQQSPSPRVQLELARALYLDHKYRSARELFNSVLDRPNIPWAVRRNIDVYLDEIDSRLGFVHLDFALVSDSNPCNFTDKKIITILGQPMEVIEPENNEQIWGVNYSLRAARAHFDDNWLVTYVDAFFTDYEGGDFDRFGANVGIQVTPPSFPEMRFKAGLNENFYAGDHFYEYPYGNIIYSPNKFLNYDLKFDFELGYLKVIDASYLDAVNTTLTTSLSTRNFGKIRWTGDLYLEGSHTDEKAYTYYGGSIGATLYYSIIDSLELRPSLSFGKRTYQGTDPFWGQTRDDDIIKISFSIVKSNLQIFGYTPEVGVAYQENYSNIDYYNYSKVALITNFTR